MSKSACDCVHIYDHVCITSLLTSGKQEAARGATGFNARTGEFLFLKAKLGRHVLSTKRMIFHEPRGLLSHYLNLTGDGMPCSGSGAVMAGMSHPVRVVLMAILNTGTATLPIPGMPAPWSMPTEDPLGRPGRKSPETVAEIPPGARPETFEAEAATIYI
jgi:hypothetical protein